jgi:hypothetical protein
MVDVAEGAVTSTDKTCGLIMPISAIDGCSVEHWAEVKAIVVEALKDTGFTVDLVSNANEAGIIQQRIVTNVYSSDIVVCDVSAKNPNVMFELGMRLAFDKPTIIIKDDKTNYSFDTSPIEHIEYPRDLHYHLIQRFKEILRSKVLATYKKSLEPDYVSFLKNFGAFTVAKVEPHEVSSEEFILQTLKEMRGELNQLNRISRPSRWYREEGYYPSNFSISKKDTDELRHILSNVSDENLSQLLDANSSQIDDLLSTYMTKRSAPGGRQYTTDELRSQILSLIGHELKRRSDLANG